MPKAKKNPDPDFAPGEPPVDLSDYSEAPPIPETKEEPLITASFEEPVLNMGEPEEKKRKYTKRAKSTEDESLVDGEMLLLMCDIIFPMIIATTSNNLAGTKINADDLFLTEKQKHTMKKFADKVAEKINLNVNPMAGFVVGMAGIYTMNYVEAKK